MADLASLVLRLGLGVMFFAHGLQLALNKFGGPGPKGFSQMLTGLGFAPALFWAYLAGYTTLIGGLFLILGLFTRGAAFALIIFMLVALIKVHLSKGFFLMNGGYEYNFIVICALIALMILGSGKYGITPKI
ncbi:MAG: DoxX family protein [Candidatus Omnitrophica bacterium]|nr:DoxX family protein [Candidatus Omnitrophota bacterium]